MAQKAGVTILGVFVADTTYRADRAPRMGETILGNAFQLGPGGKGSNQAVAAAKLGAAVNFITNLGDDAFADLAESIWKEAGVTPSVQRRPESYTGAAYVFVEEATGNNAIIVCPGAALTLTPDDIRARAEMIAASAIFMTQLEQPLDAAVAGLQIAKQAGVTTIFNPAPAMALDDTIYPFCDYVTPNETEAAELTGIPVATAADARAAGEIFLAKGVHTAIITMGEQGAYIHNRDFSELVPAVSAGSVIETTGAGDAFNGAFATALARGDDPVSAVNFGCAAAGISVTRAGTALSMPVLKDVTALMDA